LNEILTDKFLVLYNKDDIIHTVHHRVKMRLYIDLHAKLSLTALLAVSTMPETCKSVTRGSWARV